MRFPHAVSVLLFIAATQAQPQPNPTTLTAVPRLVRISSVYHAENGSAPAATQTATIAIFAAEIGGTPLWQETQNVSADADGHYSLLIGSSRTEGLPVELFSSREPRC